MLLTTDTSLRFQQNLSGSRLAVVILSRNRWKVVRRILPAIAAAVWGAKPGTLTVLEIPDSWLTERKIYGFTFSAEAFGFAAGNSQCSTHFDAKNSISTFLCFTLPVSSGATISDCGPSETLNVH